MRGSTAELDELEQLVEEGDTLELVGKLAAIVREPQRLSVDEPNLNELGAGAAEAAPARSELV